MSQPESHLFEVTLQVSSWESEFLDLKMPVWTPGSYLVREYSKHLQNLVAFSHKNENLIINKLSKNYWRIDTKNINEVTVKYQIFAHELSVRTNHLDSTHGYFNPAALCFYIVGKQNYPYQIKINPPHSDWQISTPLVSVDGTFIAEDFDTLVDSPFEIGKHQIYEFQVLGKKHQLAVWGTGNIEPQKLIKDIEKLIEVEAKIFGGLPYDRYLFILHLAATGGGGLEHKYSCTLNYPRFGFRDRDKYNRFLQLVAHEFFHLWNVKRIRPIALEKFDYEQENYTPSLWFSEGTTSYYDLIIPHRAGIYDTNNLLENLSKEITKYLGTPGRLVQPVSESSFDAWIKLYRQDANSANSQISYYLKGELVSFLLDLLIRNKWDNERSLDDVMLQMWEQFGKSETGFTPNQLQQIIENVASIELKDFFAKYIDGTQELPFNEYLAPFGLHLIADPDPSIPYLGITVKTENNREIIKYVAANSPAQQVGIDPGDELLAINNFKVTSEQLTDRLKDFSAGDKINVFVFHQDELRSYWVTLDAPRPSRYQVVLKEDADILQKRNLARWLGTNRSKP
ncbi:peptidase M61 [Merismopedia glauca CCAP 1448/3]|uniref:Peptidase M61 n=2 Tax=Merismopedia TaxID=53402 RepID=A0A2T1C3U8_9CYAN|nr:peptidase M61 [Merismopedia glauca CCAP 1448/3]